MVVIDIGIFKRDFLQRMLEAGLKTQAIQGLLLTHDHSDHVKGVGVILRGLAKEGIVPRVFVESAVYERVPKLAEDLKKLNASVQFIGAHELQRVAGLTITPFRTSHDAISSLGFAIEDESDGDKLGYITDTGIVTPEAKETLRGVRLLALESNHDERMLRQGPYPAALKARIASDQGHLSNDQAAAELKRQLNDPDCCLETVVAMHISQENNSYRLPRESLERVVALGQKSVTIAVAYQGRLTTIS